MSITSGHSWRRHYALWEHSAYVDKAAEVSYEMKGPFENMASDRRNDRLIPQNSSTMMEWDWESPSRAAPCPTMSLTAGMSLLDHSQCLRQLHPGDGYAVVTVWNSDKQCVLLCFGDFARSVCYGAHACCVCASQEHRSHEQAGANGVGTGLHVSWSCNDGVSVCQ